MTKSVDELMRLHDDAVGAQIAFLHAGFDADAFNAMADDEAAALGDVQDTRAALRSALEEVVAENVRLIEDRARFPDRPDDIGRMIGSHLKNLETTAKNNEDAWRAASARAAAAERYAERIEIDGHTLAPADVLKRIIRKRKRGRPLWAAVHEASAHGSTVSAGLCRWAGVDPDTGAAMQQAPEQEA